MLTHVCVCGCVRVWVSGWWCVRGVGVWVGVGVGVGVGVVVRVCARASGNYGGSDRMSGRY